MWLWVKKDAAAGCINPAPVPVSGPVPCFETIKVWVTERFTERFRNGFGTVGVVKESLGVFDVAGEVSKGVGNFLPAHVSVQCVGDESSEKSFEVAGGGFGHHWAGPLFWAIRPSSVSRRVWVSRLKALLPPPPGALRALRMDRVRLPVASCRPQGPQCPR